jgi:hypothetical protein
MSLSTDTPSWTLSDLARGQVIACGIALSEVYRVLRKPQLMMPAPERGMKYSGYGLVVVIDGPEILSVIIDGASQDNWQDWAVERALFGDGDVAGADALLHAEVTLPPPPAERPAQVSRRRGPQAPSPTPLTTSHVLDKVHPALRAEITRQVDGDFSRLVVHSSTKVTVLPPD